MAKRKCDGCGLMKEDDGNGRECVNGHWNCRGCVRSGSVEMERTTCNICGEPLLKK